MGNPLEHLYSGVRHGGHLVANLVSQIDNVPYTEKHYPDLTGTVWIVTGATGRIGFETALLLARQNATVWLAGRSPERLEQTMQDIKSRLNKPSVYYFVIDFDDLASIKKGVQPFLAQSPRLDGVIHNSGIFAASDYTTKQGYEAHLGTNNIAPQLLQELVTPLLIKTCSESAVPGRIVWVSSDSSLDNFFSSNYNLTNARRMGESPTDRYNTSKAISLVQSMQWSSHYPKAHVISLAVYPGITSTSKGQSVNKATHVKPIRYGAYTELYAALCPDLKIGHNYYVMPWGKLGSPQHGLVEAASDPKRGGALWQWIRGQYEQYL